MMRDELPYDAETHAALRRRLQQLDDDHKRARSPSARRRIERAMREVAAEEERLAALANVVDIEWARWMRDLKQTLGGAG